ncbi:hypothetical protein AVEN_44943-1 [Araneus ventricosus]|uniref:Uncharacterized protein n=1 Tax=Araneus ventricosus TaxID=182803 RepID=A0A4Y2SDX6_ARAVE|nr:hypothetical protein AVEN_44943-1 [Araneus ventricosus]
MKRVNYLEPEKPLATEGQAQKRLDYKLLPELDHLNQWDYYLKKQGIARKGGITTSSPHKLKLEQEKQKNNKRTLKPSNVGSKSVKTCVSFVTKQREKRK